MNFDTVVVGSGAAGLTTAIVAAQAGQKVLVVEKAKDFGGTTATSGGSPWIIANRHQPDMGIDDSPAAGELYLRTILGELYDDEMVSAFIESGSEMVNHLEDTTHVLWGGTALSDYFPDEPGANFGRPLWPQPYDGRVLGRTYLRRLRQPIRGYTRVFGSMQVDPAEQSKLLAAFKEPAAFFYSAGRLLAYGRDLARFGRGAHLANGNALVGRLLRSALDANVTLWSSSPALRLVADGDAVTGVVVDHAGTVVTVGVSRGVVLASGGFGANVELRNKYIPTPDAHVSAVPDENVGDGIRIGIEAGGRLGDVNPENAVWSPISLLPLRDGSVRKYPHFGPDRAKPGSIIVDTTAKRFVNEAAPYPAFVRAMHEQGVTTAYFIANRRFLRKYGMGFALPSPYPVGTFIRRGYLVEAPSISELAVKLGLDPAALSKTVDDFNDTASIGVDPVFHRGENGYDPTQGDPDHKPNANLASVGEGPYYALTLRPGDVSTVLGLATNSNAQVLNGSGDVVDGLYAVGTDQNTVMRGVYPGGGSGIGPAMTFGYRAARHLSGVLVPTPVPTAAAAAGSGSGSSLDSSRV
jgi:succinate dehydrogenase/fumarate reductase flavoprotein subunit